MNGKHVNEIGKLIKFIEEVLIVYVFRMYLETIFNSQDIAKQLPGSFN